MADLSEEIDDFAIFKARSLGAESEYLVLAKAGQLRGPPAATRTPDSDESSDQSPNRRGQRQRNTSRCSGGGGGEETRRSASPCSMRDDSCSPKSRRSGAHSYSRSDSTKTETLETRNELFPLDEEGGRLQRAHSYRSRRSPQPQSHHHHHQHQQHQHSSHHLHLVLGANGHQSESKLNRSRTMTMPARRPPTASAAGAGAGGGGGGGKAPRASIRGGWGCDGADATTANGASPSSSPGDQPVMDRAVLRVRNFTTKSGNIVNRGDSIKVRGGRSSEFRSSSGSVRSSGGGGGGGGGSRPASLKDEAGVDASSSSPSSRPSLSRHSSRGSCKYIADAETVVSPMGFGGSHPLAGSAPSAQNLLSPVGGYGVCGQVDDSQVNTHLQVPNGRDQEPERGRRSRVKVESGTDEDVVVYKVLVLGSQGVGKTTLTMQLLTSEYLANNENDNDDESRDRIVSVQVDDEESLLQFIDSVGSESSQPTKDRDSADANLVVYSVTDRTSFTFAHTCLQELRPAKRHNVVILVGNKQDIVRNRIISEEDGKSLAAKRHCKFIEVSALLNHKTDDLLVGITRQIRLRKARGGQAPGGPQGQGPASPDSGGGPVGCLQRVAVDAFRKIFKRRRPAESTSCDDLFTP